MKLARVVGTVVATVQAPVFDGRRLLLCELLAVPPAAEPAAAALVPTDGYLIAVDTVGAGAGETVLILDEGTSARQIVGVAPAPIRAVVVGVVDAVDIVREPAPATTVTAAPPAADEAHAAEPGRPARRERSRRGRS